MRPLIGVLLNRGTLERGLRGASSFERLDLYVDAARELNVDLLFFQIGGVRLKKREVVGYKPAAGGAFERTVAPLPAVVHKRGLYLDPRERRAVKRLERCGVYLFNPEVVWDKYAVQRLLEKEPALRPYLPPTLPLGKGSYRWFKEQLHDAGEVFIKPRRGSLGLGIARVVRLGAGRYRYEARRRSKVTSLKGAWKLARGRRGRFILQRGVQLLEDEGRRVDLRVPVQLDGDGRWRVPGMAAKRAGRSRFLTNLARGGSAHPARDVLVRHFGKVRARDLVAEIEHVALLVARTINARYPRMVDLGLDIGVDVAGRPYLFEVNRRDLRILLDRSGQEAVFRTLYRNPIAYARSVLERG